MEWNSRFLVENRMDDQVRGVALDSLSSCGCADDMRKICTLGIRSLACVLQNVDTLECTVPVAMRIWLRRMVHRCS
jgi:hypothetical protein